MNTKKYIRTLYVTAAVLYGLAFLFAATWNNAAARDGQHADQAPFEMFAEEILSGKFKEGDKVKSVLRGESVQFEKAS